MNKQIIFFISIMCIILTNCITIDNSVENANKNSDVYLEVAIRNAVIDMKEKIPKNNIVALVNFDTFSTEFSKYLIDELTNILINESSFRIVERRQLEIIQEELKFQMSGAVSDETAKSIGKFLGADTIITGTFLLIGNKYRVGIKSIQVETGLIQSLYIKNVSINKELISIIGSTNTSSYVASNSLIKNTNTNEFSSQNNRIKVWGSSSVISPDGRWVISVSGLSSPYKINIYDILDGNLLRSFPVPDPYVALWSSHISYNSINVNIDGKIIGISSGGTEYSGETIGRILLYDVLTGRMIYNIKINDGPSLSSDCYILFNPVKNQLLSSIGNKIYLFDLETGNKKSISINKSAGNNITSIIYSTDGSRIAVGDHNGNITVLDGYSLRITNTLKGHTGKINSVAFNPTNNILISGSDDFTISVWDLSKNRELFTLTEHLGEINTVIYTLSGNAFLSSSKDGTVKLWNSSNYSVIKSWSNGKQFWPSKIILSLDGNYFIPYDGVLYKIDN